MNLKKNIKQAAAELLGGPKVPKDEQAKPPEGKPAVPSIPETQESPALLAPSRREREAKPFTQKGLAGVSPSTVNRTVIAADDVLQGNLQCAGDIEVYGTVNGDITGKGDIKLCGKQEGNTAGHNIEMCAGQIKGVVVADGNMKVDETSIVIGNITAETLILNGKVKGDLDIQTSVTLEKNAVVSGKISAGSLSVENGAAIQGEVIIRCSDYSSISESEKHRDSMK